MCVLLFDVFKNLLLRKTGVLKTCWKSEFFGKNILRNALAIFEEQKGTRYIWEKVLFWHYYLQLSLVYKTIPHIFLKIVFFRR